MKISIRREVRKERRKMEGRAKGTIHGKALFFIILFVIPLIFMALMFNPFISIINSNLVNGQAPKLNRVRVLYLNGYEGFDNSSGSYNDKVEAALSLDKENIEYMGANSSDWINFSVQDRFDVIILNDYNLTAEECNDLKIWLSVHGHGLITIMGPTLSNNTLILDILGITPGVRKFEINKASKDSSERAISAVTETASKEEAIVRGIAWNSAPELINFTQIKGATLSSDVHQYIYMKYYNGTFSDSNLIIGKSLINTSASSKEDNILVFAGWFNESVNREYQLWPYFNYLIFGSVQSVVGNPVITYKDWAYSPVPHLKDQILLGIFVLSCTIVTIPLYIKMRKKGKNVRKKFELIEEIEEHLEEGVTIKEYLEEKKRGSKLSKEEEELLSRFVISKDAKLLVEIAKEGDLVDKKDVWEEVGFHRQTAGFLQTFFTLIFLIIPQLIVTSFIFPNFIQPHPQSTGYYSFTLHFFEAIWLIFDMGTSYSFIKFFSENRIERPEKAFHYAQIFVWWEILSGLVQILLVAFLGSVVFPSTSLAYLSWMFIAHSLIQFPGFLQVFQFFFESIQRTDKAMITYVLQYFLLRMAAQVIVIPIFRAIYSGNMVYGDAFGAGLGMIAGMYVGDVTMFLITLYWYKKMHLGIAPLFRAEFTKREFKKSIIFGGKMAIGEVWVPAVWMLQVYLVSIFIPNYAAEQGYFELAFTIATIPQAAALIYENVLPGLTEAWRYNKKTLLNYITGASMRLGMFWTFFLCAALWAIGKMFVIGTAGYSWIRAADLLYPLIIFQILGPFSWQGDKEFAASNHPGLAGIAWVLEQSLRAGFLFLFLWKMPIMESVIYAYIISLSIKDVFVWIIIEFKIHKHKWYPWSTFVAPGLSAICSYFILKLLGLVIWRGEILTTSIIFLLTFFVVLFIFSFFNGFFGGYDKNTIKEFEKSANIVKGVGGLARLLYKSAELGTRISPIHDKFKIDIYEEAYKEAAELTSIKKKLKA